MPIEEVEVHFPASSEPAPHAVQVQADIRRADMRRTEQTHSSVFLKVIVTIPFRRISEKRFPLPYNTMPCYPSQEQAV